MNEYRTILVYGFALFAMFFGSGNLVFPIEIGIYSQNAWLYGFIGLLTTGILLPFLGLFVIKLYKGNYHNFFAEAGPVARFLLPLFTLSLLGSFGVVPRCITVAYGGISYISQDIPLIAFSIIFSLITFILCQKDQVMLNILGKWMSPVLLFCLLVLITSAIFYADKSNISSNIKIHDALENGFITGYQTMDLFAAFFFSSLIFAQIQHIIPKNSNPRQVIKFMIKPSIIAASLLALIYLGFVYLGAHYANILRNVEPEYMLPTIAEYTLGKHASLFIGIAILFSCLTTAIALSKIYADYIHTLLEPHLKLEMKFGANKSKFSFTIILALTTFISCLVSLLDFKGISSFLAPVLEISYPGIIALTILSIVSPQYKKAKIIAFYLITFIAIMNVL
jgi:branched-chain amino acid:cation transporter, LIVCS family